jgi:hypothetical protein
MPYIYNDEDNAPMNDDAMPAENFPVEERDCKHCQNHDGDQCQVWDCHFVKREPVPALNKCHERCRYSKPCWELFKCNGSDQADFPDECALYYKLDDLAMDAQDIAEEQRRARCEDDDELPFTEPEEDAEDYCDGTDT